MLNGIAPIMIFHFFKTVQLTAAELPKTPIAGDATTKTMALLPPIPVYLDENLTGLCIQTESKNVDIITDSTALTDSSQDVQNRQNALSSTVTVVMKARRGTIGLALLSALIDVLYKKVTAHEYGIDYLHGSIIILGSLLHSFEINETEDNDLSEIKITLINPSKQKLTGSIADNGKSLVSGTAAVHP